jgi:hypothetical protein
VNPFAISLAASRENAATNHIIRILDDSARVRAHPRPRAFRKSAAFVVVIVHCCKVLFWIAEWVVESGSRFLSVPLRGFLKAQIVDF